MSTLTGQQIQNTYQGLLKLSDSTTGITSSYQQVQDGLGNNTNFKISTAGILAPNITAINNLKPDYAGIGYSSAAVTPVASTQNRTLYCFFYDNGIYDYSAITYNVITATTSSDSVTVAFYTMQLVPGIGLAPKDLVLSGITLTTNSTGVKTTALPSNLSFSGTGGGFYIMAMIISNANVTPTIRFANGILNTNNQSLGTTLGLYLNNAGTALNIGHKMNTAGSTVMYTLNNLSSFQTSYSVSDITTNIATTVISPAYGFALNTAF